MGIRVKILLIIVVVFALLLALAGYMLNVAVYDNLARLEREDIAERTNRLDELFAQQLSALNASTQDWAAWDNTYHYINQPNATFERVDLSTKSLDLVKFNVVALTNLKGNALVHVESLDGAYRLARHLPPELAAQLQSSIRSATGECGLLNMRPFPLLFCLRPVMPSEMNHPSNGYLLTGRYLTQERMDELRRTMKHTLSLRFEPPKTSTTLDVEGDSGPYKVGFNDQGNQQYEIFKEFKGTNGKPQFWMRFIYERSRAEQSASVFVRMLIWVTGALWVIVLLLYVLLERVLVRRLSGLKGVVEHASKHHDWSAEVPHTKDRDEIGRLASGIDVLFHEMAKNVSQLEAESLEDALTLLPNRRDFDQKLDLYWQVCQRHRQPLTVMMIDVDHFKGFNDLYGHQAGDETLVKVAAALRSALLRATDFVARYGGEEFAVILPDSNHPVSTEIAERLRGAVESLHIRHPGNASGVLTISIGLASCDLPRPDMSGTDLLHHADLALYEAKGNGRNRFKSVSLIFSQDQRKNNRSAGT